MRTAFMRAHPKIPRVNQAELRRLAEGLGIDAIGAAPAEPYAETERHIRERRARGLFADMRFTMAQPEVSCHPESLLPNARTVVSAAYSYYAPGREPLPGEGRLPRYTWFDAYSDLREKLDELGRRLGGSYRVLVDANQHVDRAGAVRAGVAFYGKNTLAIPRRQCAVERADLALLLVDARAAVEQLTELADAARRRIQDGHLGLHPHCHQGRLGAGVEQACLVRRFGERHDVAERRHAVVAGHADLAARHVHDQELVPIGPLGSRRDELRNAGLELALDDERDSATLDRLPRERVPVDPLAGNAEEDRTSPDLPRVVCEVGDLDRPCSGHLARGERPDQGVELHCRRG